MLRDARPRYVVRPVAFSRGGQLPVRYRAVATPQSASGNLPCVLIPHTDQPTRRLCIETASFRDISALLPEGAHFTYQL